MSDSIGPKIVLEGEKEYKQAIKDINADMRVFSSEMKKLTAEFADNSNSVEALTKKGEILEKQINSQKEKVETLRKALQNSVEQYGENDNKTKQWQKTLNEAEAELSNLTREAKNNEEAIRNAGKGAEESGGKFEKLGGVLKGAVTAMGTLAVAAGAAAVKLGKEVVGQFGELEQNLGGSEAVFGEYAERIQKAGEEAYKNLGVSQSEYLATANKMGALFQGSGVEQQKSLELTEKAMQRAADMASVMGIDMQTALDSIAGAAKGNFTMMDNLGVKMNAASIEAYALAKGLDFTWSKATEAEKAEMAMQMFFENTEQYAGNFARESTETITGSLGLLQAALGSFVAGLGNTDADMQNLTENLVDAFNSVVQNITPVIENITSALPEAFGAILPAIGELLPEFLTIATDLFKQVLDTILTLLPELIPVAVQAVMTFVDTIIENLPLIIEGALTLIVSLAEGIVQALPELIPAIIDTITTIVDTLIDNIDMIIDTGIELILGLANGLIDALPKLIEKIPEIIEKLVNALVNNAPKIMEASIKLIETLAGGLIKNIPTIVKSIPEIVIAIVRGFAEMTKDIAGIGKNLVEGIWNGIKDATGWILDKIKGFGESVLNGIKKIFGIHSPSRVFRDEVGKNLALGLGEGFTEEMNALTKDMSNAIPTDFEVNGMLNTSANGIGGADGIYNLLERIANRPLILNINGREFARVTAQDMSIELQSLSRSGSRKIGVVTA